MIKCIIIWQDKLEVNPSVLIGSLLVGILPYGPFINSVFFSVFESRQIQNLQRKLRKENV